MNISNCFAYFCLPLVVKLKDKIKYLIVIFTFFLFVSNVILQYLRFDKIRSCSLRFIFSPSIIHDVPFVGKFGLTNLGHCFVLNFS